jgi:predicted kinase
VNRPPLIITPGVPKLIITRGLPASGKSTWARLQQREIEGLVRVNRDDLRGMLRPEWAFGSEWYERMCTEAQMGSIERLLRLGLSVIADDTHLNPAHIAEYGALLLEAGADSEIVDFTGVSLEECIRRDAGRADRVGELVIRAMHEAYLAGPAA